MSKRKKSGEFNFDKDQSQKNEQSSKASLKNFGVTRPGRETQSNAKPADLWDLSADENASEARPAGTASADTSPVSEKSHTESSDSVQSTHWAAPTGETQKPQVANTQQSPESLTSSDSHWGAPPQIQEQSAEPQQSPPKSKKKSKRQSVLQQVSGQALPSPQQAAADSRPNIEFEESARNNKTAMFEKPNFEALQAAQAESKKSEPAAPEPPVVSKTPTPSPEAVVEPSSSTETQALVTRWLPPPRKDTQSNALPVQKHADLIGQESPPEEQTAVEPQLVLEPHTVPELNELSQTTEPPNDTDYSEPPAVEEPVLYAQSEPSIYETAAPLIPPAQEVFNVQTESPIYEVPQNTYVEQQATPSPSEFATTSPPVFGMASTPFDVPTTPSPSLFGNAPSPFETSTTTSPSLFGNAASPFETSTTTSPSLFGDAPSPFETSTTPSPSLFGNAPSPFETSTTPSPSEFAVVPSPPETSTTPSPPGFAVAPSSSEFATDSGPHRSSQRRTIVQEFDLSKLVKETQRQTVEVKKLELEPEPQFDSAMHYFTASAERMTYTAELRFRASYTPPEKKAEAPPPPPEASWNRTEDDLSSGSNNNTFGFKFLNDFVPPRQDFPAAEPRSGFNMLDLIDEGYRAVQPNPTFSQTRGPGKVEVAVDWVNSGGRLPPSSREGLAGGFGGATKAPQNQFKKNWLKNK